MIRVHKRIAISNNTAEIRSIWDCDTRDFSAGRPTHPILASRFDATPISSRLGPMAKLNSPFDQIFSEEEILTLRDLRKPHGGHPLVSVALHPGGMQALTQRAVNTSNALKQSLRVHSDWVVALKPRLLDPLSWSESDSALGELRAMGSLLQAGFKVTPGKKDVTGAHGNTEPEFFINFDGVDVVVEVWTRTGDRSDPSRIAAEHRASSKTETLSRGGTLTTSMAVHVPFGMPQPEKAGDSALTNTISRLASVKRDEHQARTSKPFVVWVDLQGEALTFDHSSSLIPLSTFNGELYSGGYWCAFYARKGDLLFEGDRFRSVGSSRMLHEGRFYQTKKNGEATKTAAFVLSSPDTTSVFEHPNADVPIPDGFRSALMDLPLFALDRCVLNWAPGLVASTVEAQRKWIEAVAAAVTLRDA